MGILMILQPIHEDFIKLQSGHAAFEMEGKTLMHFIA